MKQAVVFLKGVKAGLLTEDEEGPKFWGLTFLAEGGLELIKNFGKRFFPELKRSGKKLRGELKLRAELMRNYMLLARAWWSLQPLRG